MGADCGAVYLLHLGISAGLRNTVFDWSGIISQINTKGIIDVKHFIVSALKHTYNANEADILCVTFNLHVQECIFSIPTGAFGNAMGGYIAKQMGIPIHRIICATNSNDIVHRVISAGDFSMGANVPTHSPAMDIQFAYNLERMLYYICNQNPHAVSDIMRKIDDQFAFKEGSSGVFLDRLLLNELQKVFVSCSVNDEHTLATIRDIRRDHGFDLCPHSAIGVYAALNVFSQLTATRPTLCVLTANAAKFEESFTLATGQSPVISDSVAELRNAPQKFRLLSKDGGCEWRQQWIATLKSDIINSQSSS